jgi:hypothetical protein
MQFDIPPGSVIHRSITAYRENFELTAEIDLQLARQANDWIRQNPVASILDEESGNVFSSR